MARKVVKVRKVVKYKVPRGKSKPPAQPTPKPERVNTVKAAAGANPKHLVIEDRTLKTLVTNAGLAASIPCLRQAKLELDRIAVDCARCSVKKKKQTAAAMNQLRSCLAGLSGNSLKAFKAALGVEKVTIMTKSKGGGIKPTVL